MSHLLTGHTMDTVTVLPGMHVKLVEITGPLSLARKQILATSMRWTELSPRLFRFSFTQRVSELQSSLFVEM